MKSGAVGPSHPSVLLHSASSLLSSSSCARSALLSTPHFSARLRLNGDSASDLATDSLDLSPFKAELDPRGSHLAQYCLSSACLLPLHLLPLLRPRHPCIDQPLCPFFPPPSQHQHRDLPSSPTALPQPSSFRVICTPIHQQQQKKEDYGTAKRPSPRQRRASTAVRRGWGVPCWSSRRGVWRLV